MKSFWRLLVVWVFLLITLVWTQVFANDESVCVHRAYRNNSPASLDQVEDFNGTARLTQSQRIDFYATNGQVQQFSNSINDGLEKFQGQFCAENIIILQWLGNTDHINFIKELHTAKFQKDTAFASCTFINIVPNQDIANNVAAAVGTWSYIYQRTKFMEKEWSTAWLPVFYEYPTHFENRSTWNVTFPYYMIINQDGEVIKTPSMIADGYSAVELLQEMQWICRSYDCDGVETSSQFPSDAEEDVDNDNLRNNDPKEYDIDWDGQLNLSPTERHHRGDVDGDGAKNIYDMDIDCDGIPNARDDTPYGNTDIDIPTCGDGVHDLGVTDELCDDGNGIDTDSCTNECKFAVCGDGIVSNYGPTESLTWYVETCDDGNTTNNDGCNAECESEFCGDWIIQRWLEECDDANGLYQLECENCVFIRPENEIPEPEENIYDPPIYEPGTDITWETDTFEPGTDIVGESDAFEPWDDIIGETTSTSPVYDDGWSLWWGSTTNGSANTGLPETSWWESWAWTDTTGSNNTTSGTSTAWSTNTTSGVSTAGESDGEWGELLAWWSWPNRGTVAGNSGGSADWEFQVDGLTCLGEYDLCVASCTSSTVYEVLPSLIWWLIWPSYVYAQSPVPWKWVWNPPTVPLPIDSPWAAPDLCKSSKTNWCICACQSKAANCGQCVRESWWSADAQTWCACKYFDHIYLNTKIPFIGQCILKRTWSDTDISQTSIPDLNTAFPRLLSGMSRLIQSLILIAAFVAIVIAGFMISAGGMSEWSATKGKNIIKWVIIALILLWASWIILNLINPNFFR